jgi:large subunit ribosomal protein L29
VSTKRFTELKNLSKQELVSKVRETELQLFQARMKQATGQLQDTALLWRLRKDLARMKMLQGQVQAQAEK